MEIYEFIKDYTHNESMVYDTQDRLGIVYEEEYIKIFDGTKPMHEVEFLCDINGEGRGMTKAEFQKLIESETIKLLGKYDDFDKFKKDMWGYY